MKGYIGYIRVSTVKQGVHGVSLQEQRSAIAQYAERNQLPITIWLEEMETAAKQGRPVFSEALKLLRAGKMRGIILHKLDRGARNLRDWAAIGELSDQGVEVHFVSEGIDLQSRGGRLSADIQAVVAADYIRNLREETRKGFYGRLKQGFYPLQAPLGYKDEGGGKAKTIDPIRGPLVRKAFDLYSTGGYNLDTLSSELYRHGLRTRKNAKVTRSRLSFILNNPFYMGLIYIKTTNETFTGVHEPLVSKPLFDRVQAVLTGKVNAKTQRHNFVYRRMLSCAHCNYSLIGERQKGHVYYRCHERHEPRTSVREDAIEQCLGKYFGEIRFDEEEKEYFHKRVLQLRENWKDQRAENLKNVTLRLSQIKDRLNRLTDAYLDEALDKATFEERKKSLLLEQKDAEDCLSKAARNTSSPDDLDKFLELAGNAWLSHQKGSPDEKRELVKKFTSNRLVSGKEVVLKPPISLQDISKRYEFTSCGPKRDIPRTWDRILDTLIALCSQGLLPDLSFMSGFKHRADPTDPIKDSRDDGITVVK